MSGSWQRVQKMQEVEPFCQVLSNHFAKYCRTKNVNQVQPNQPSVRGNESEGEPKTGNMWSLTLQKMKDSVINWFMPYVVLFVCQTSVSFGIDTGAAVNVMDSSTFGRLKIKQKLEK